MISIPAGLRVWLATGHTDMRKGFDGLALIVQETLKRDPHGGHLFVFRCRRGDLIKCLWSDGQGLCLFAKRLERGRFLWPSTADGTVTISTAQLGYTASSADALIARLSLEIEKLRRTLYGARSERKERLIDQLEMQLRLAQVLRNFPKCSWIELTWRQPPLGPMFKSKSDERKRQFDHQFPAWLSLESSIPSTGAWNPPSAPLLDPIVERVPGTLRYT